VPIRMIVGLERIGKNKRLRFVHWAEMFSKESIRTRTVKMIESVKYSPFIGDEVSYPSTLSNNFFKAKLFFAC